MSNIKQGKALAYILVAFGTGLLFGTGLTISEMVNPEKILSFLDLFGEWNPALIFVMIGALLIAIPGFQFVQGKEQPFFALKFLLPDKTAIDKKLLSGAILFGIGWGMVGLCPGPAVTALVTLRPEVFLFVVAVVAGMFCHKLMFTH
jgi:uncharacterized membrane protein YedE/YeeE